MGGDNKFYHFEGESEVIGGSSKKSGFTRERILWGLVVVALVAVIIGVVAHYVPKTKDNEDTISELKAQVGNLSPGTTKSSTGAHGTDSTAHPGTGTTTSPATQPLNRRIDCIPEAKGKFVKATRELCDRRGCIYDNTGVKDIPVCYHGDDRGYKVVGYSETQLGFRFVLEAKGKGPFGSDIKSAVFDIEMWNENLIRFKFDDPEFSRYKVPLKIATPSSKSSATAYEVKITNNQTFAFQIIRTLSGKVLWDTSVGGLVLSDQFLQISTMLPTNYVYGFGENSHPNLRHDMNHKTWPMFTAPRYGSDPTNGNLYGVHPFYTCLEGDGNSHGVFLLNSNAMDYSFTPLPMLTYRTIGGILDFYMFLGPSPENVIQQYTGIIGRPYMPPYWALGFQLCRYGYRDLSHMQQAVERTKTHAIPHDVQYVDVDYMDKFLTFTLDNATFGGLPDYFTSLRNGGMHTVVILDAPFISNVSGYEPYDRLSQAEGAVKWPADYNAATGDKDSTNAMLGYAMPNGKVVFPDFLNNKTRTVWSDLIVKHKARIPFDGLWIAMIRLDGLPEVLRLTHFQDMNEPENWGTNEEKPWNWPQGATPYWSMQCPTNNRYEEPPYRTMAGFVHDTPDRAAKISDRTLCMVGRQGDSGEYRHYDVHSLYGWSQAMATMRGVQRSTGERGFVLSRSTYPGSGKYASHWLGDNRSQWPDLKASIIGILEFNMFGIPHVGADVCGFEGNATAELCKRWMQLGAFYPFSRQHNRKGDLDQDPGYFGAEVGIPAREAMETRYWLLPYLYTLFHKAHATGGTVARPIFHEFPDVSAAYEIDEQFMWGPNLMIVPVLELNASRVVFYKPPGVWYDFYSGSGITQQPTATSNVDSNSKIPLFVRGGAILPMQKPDNNTYFSRQNAMKLLVALDENRSASGELFWDDGVSIDTYESGNYFYAKFQADEHTVSMTIEHDHYGIPYLHFDEIQIYGAHGGIKQVIYDGRSLAFNLAIDGDKNHPKSVLTISNITIPLNKEFTVYLSTLVSDETTHIDCYPEVKGGVEKVTQASCETRGCTYSPSGIGPACYINLENYGYRVVGDKVDTDLGFYYKLEHKGKPNPYSYAGSKDVKNVNFKVEMRGNDVLRIKFEDAVNERYEVPIKLNIGSRKATDPRYEVKITSNDPFSFQVIRKNNGEILWDTGVGGLTFSDQFLQLATTLPSNYIYGFGENVHHSFKHDLQFKSWPMWSRDQPVGWGSGLNHYGVHPFYTCMENGGHSHGVLLLNSNAQDYSFTPKPMLTYRTIGGVLDFYMFLGPEPENVVQQYTGMIGRPYMPPYWSLGFQLCRYGYNNLTNLRNAAERTIAAQIPYDVQYADIDHMDERRDFTIDPVNFAGLKDYFDKLRSEGMHTIIILDPALISNNTGYNPYDRMRDTNSNIKWASNEAHIPTASSTANKDLLGFVWPKGKAVFPDFFKNSTGQVWKELITKHHNNNLTFDGLWIDMNEPASFGTNEERPFNWPEDDKPYWSLNCTLEGSTIEHPPYRTMAAYIHDNKDSGRKAMLSDKTICLRAVQGEGGKYIHYNVHSLYGWSQTLPTLEGLREATGERGIVISRSTFPGSGQYSGHWLGDNDSKWEEMRLSIIGLLEFNLFGIPYIGADICGFFGNTNPELCKRWMQLGAFYTFSRNHNGLGNIEQDPAALGEDVKQASKVALETRYQLLPYLYTLFHHAHVKGNTVIRPLHHVFPYDVSTYQVDKQFMWGPALMISPILYEGQTSLTMYLPQGPWYDFYTGKEMPVQGSFMTMPVDQDSKIPLHVHAGHILPLQGSANNTHFSRQKPFTLLVALEDSENGGRGFRARGELFWDDAKSVDTYEKGAYYYATFRSNHDTLSMHIEHSNESTINGLLIESIFVMGVQTNVKHIYIGDNEHKDISYNSELKVLKVNGLTLPLSKDFHLEWREFKRPLDEALRRFDCYPDIDDKADATARPECEKRGCTFDPLQEMPFVPKCYIDRSQHDYTVQSKPTADSVLVSKKSSKAIFGSNINTLKVVVERKSETLLRLKIFDPNNARYEVPLDLSFPSTNFNASNTLYDVEIPDNNKDFFIKVKRKATNKVIFDTSSGPLLFSDQYIQITSALASDNFYGLGEHRHFNLKHNMDYKTWPIFTRDAAVNSPDYTNLYGAYPFYMNLEDDKGNTHAVFLRNSNAMEVLLEPQPRLTFRTIGGVLDFYIFLGPEPESVIQQYTQMVGQPVMVPYWSLGFQLSRWGYNSFENLKSAVERTREAGIPHDVQFADIDALDERRDFTVGFPKLPEYVEEIKAGGMRFIVIVDPGIISNNTNYGPYDDGVQKDVFIKWPPGKGPADSKPPGKEYMLGYVWPKGKTAFPDFLKENATEDYWIQQIVKYQDILKFDGLWIDMNEPANFDTNGEKPWNWPEKDKPYWSLKCTLDNNKWDQPPYKPRSVLGDLLSEKTLCMNGIQNDGQFKHYDVHSLYGMGEAKPTMLGIHQATGKRGLVISRSTYPTAGRYTSHWLGDNDAKWTNLHDSIIGIIEFNLFGIPMIGADICGFFNEPTVEMCQRWMQLGAFYTFSRNHNSMNNKEQDPAVFGKHVADSSRKAYETRYSLLPYLYTQFHRVHSVGGTVIRSMLHEFAADKRTWDIDTQFMWADALLIAPVLEQGHFQKDVYLPDARWFDYFTGREFMFRKRLVTVDAPRDYVPLFVRGGYILPKQDHANNTVFSRRNPMKLLVALGDNNTAQGDLFWDDGESIDTYEKGTYFYAKLNADESSVSMTIEHDNFDISSLHFNEIKIYGAPVGIKRVTYDALHIVFDYEIDESSDNRRNVLTLSDIHIPLNKDFSIFFSYDVSDEAKHLDCFPEAQGGVEHVTKANCEARGCIFNMVAVIGPKCYLDVNGYGYRVVEKHNTPFGYNYVLQHKGKPNPYSSLGSSDVKFVIFSVEMRGNDVLRIKFTDANSTRFEVPTTLNLASNKAVDPRYDVIVTSSDPFSFQVIRKNNGEILWDTGVGGLTFSDQFLQLATALPSNYIYGFGENVHHSFKQDLNFKTWPMWSRDQPVGWGSGLNHYGVHPFYTCMENGGHSHGVLLLNSNAQDYTFTPLPMLTYRTIGGVLDFYMFLGPEPENVVQQYTKMVGRPYMPPYWSLGFQLCRYGYNNLTNLQAAAERTIAAQIPYDVQYADIDHMDERRDFTIDPVNFAGLSDYFDNLRADGMHTIIILDPALVSNNTGYEPYDRMRDTNSNIKWASNEAHIPPASSTTNKDLLGFVWPKGKAVFPDFFKNSTGQVWKELIIKHHKYNLTFDGLWIDMNEPASFSTNENKIWNWPDDDKPYWSLNCTLEGSTVEHPPYRTTAAYIHDDKNSGRKAMLSDKTICLRAVQGEGGKYKHYDVHSLYGWSQTLPTLEGLRAATEERGIVISRSTFPGSGQYSGHWLGDNDSKWEEMRLSIIGILEFNLFGIPYIGADICGFFGNTTPELCKRWMQLGAFYTFSRNHNGVDNIEQDPAVLGEDVKQASKVALETRYKLLPYLYTLFHDAHVRGSTVIRPMHHVFPYDVSTYQIDDQFMWGPSLLISPILYQGQTSLSMYLPEGPWYDFYTGEEMPVQGSYHTISVGPDSKIPLHVRAGHILPLQAPANNTRYSRENAFTLLVALKDSENGGRGYRASGQLFWDDGVSVDTYEKTQYYHATFKSDHDTLSMTIEHNNESSINSLHIEAVTVMGVKTNVQYVYIGATAHTNLTYDSKLKVLQIQGLKIPLSSDMDLEWREFPRPSDTDLAKFDCFPDIDDRNETIARQICESRGCIYSPTPDKPYLPKCFIDSDKHGYTVQSKTGDTALLTKKGTGTLFKPTINNLKVEVERRSNSLLRIKISDKDNTRYEVPLSLNLPENQYQATNALYNVEMADNSEDFYVKVTRKSTNQSIFDTTDGPIIFSDQFIQLTSTLASDNFYGLGEHRHFHLKHSMDYKTWPIFTRDAAVNSPDYTNLYGAHPFYMNLEDDKSNTHAVFLRNSNAMEVILEPHPRLTFRTIGGVLDFYIFLGPEPETVIQQYHEVIGHPVMVPYWSLGFQLSRWGYNSPENMKAAVDRTRDARIPHDVQFADIDLLDERKDFTVGFPDLPGYIQELQAGGMHFIVINDPGIISNNTNYYPYDAGVQKDVFVKWPKGKGDKDSKTDKDFMLGYVWPKGKVVFPDFLKYNATTEYWIDQIVQYRKNLTFDGLWIDMNEPANFDTNGERPWNWPEKDKPYWSLKCTLDGNKWDQPPYKPRSVLGNVLSEKTLCMNGVQNDGMYRHYDVHSLYGMSEAKPTLLGLHKALDKRGLVISRSTYPTASRYTTHWLGDNDSFWRNLHDSIIGIIEFNLFGFPYIGADICGFFAEPSVEMCQRWMQLGAFYTFSRNHNGNGMKEQDPAMFGKHVADSSRRAFEIRYSLLPYLYTQFYRVHSKGGTIIRSMMQEFTMDKRTWSIDTQYMWAHALLIAPVLEAGHTEKEVYFPDARWFDYYTGSEITARGKLLTVDAPRDVIPLFLRGGYILPTQQPANNTVHSRRNPLGLLVVPDDNGDATGDLFWDDGDSIDTIENENYFHCTFNSTSSSISMTVTKPNAVVGDLMFKDVWVYGVSSAPTTVSATSNGQAQTAPTFEYYTDTKMLKIENTNVPLKSGFTLTWK